MSCTAPATRLYSKELLAGNYKKLPGAEKHRYQKSTTDAMATRQSAGSQSLRREKKWYTMPHRQVLEV